MTKTVFVGDVHGCCSELVRLLELVEFKEGKDRLLLTGDAFSRGPDPHGVWEEIRRTDAEMVLGNHDDRLLTQMRRWIEGENPGFAHDDQECTLIQLASVVHEILPWLAKLPLYLNEKCFLLVHAGIDPDSGLGGTTRAQFLKIRTWPPNGGIVGPRWHDHYKPTRAVAAGQLLVFGHDAPGGLVVKRLELGKRPYLLGLDSGCVYGNQLSAFLLEENRIVQVPSQSM